MTSDRVVMVVVTVVLVVAAIGLSILLAIQPAMNP